MYLCGKLPLVHPDDKHSWLLIREGDKPAFEKVFNAYYSLLCNYACRITGNINEAEEVVQTVFFNIWKKREKLQIELSVKSYLYRAVHNDCLNRIKFNKVRREYAKDQVAVNTVSDNHGRVLEAKELGRLIESAVESLPEQCGLVFRLSRFENLKYSEIAGQLDISVKTVENHMGKALRILREKLKDYLPLMFCFINIY